MLRKQGDGWSGYVRGIIPIEGFGRVDGHPWYFRMRGDAWKILIAEDRTLHEETFLVATAAKFLGWFDVGLWRDKEAMDEPDVWNVIERAMGAFKSGRLEYIERGPIIGPDGKIDR